MPAISIGSWWSGRTRWERAAWVVWAAVLLFVGARAAIKPTTLTVYPIYSGSARLWWSG